MRSYLTNEHCCFRPLYGVLLFLLSTNVLIAQNKPPSNVPAAQSVLLEGRVTDEKGDGIAGARVMVKGSQTAVSAGHDRRFSISPRMGKGVLLGSARGYSHRHSPVARNKLTVCLSPHN